MNSVNAAETSGAFYRPVTIGSLTLPGNIFLAPVAGYSDRSFRSICVDWDADFTYTEMVSSEAYIRNSVKTEKLIARAYNERRYAVQIFGANPDFMAETAVRIIERYHPECIDINAGCPMPKITKTGAGSALMRKPEKLYAVVKAVKEAVGKTEAAVPVTVKIRSGWSQNELTWKEAAVAAVDAGAAALTIHPRTCVQCYSGTADWDILAQLVQLMQGRVPVFGSGDLFSPQAAHDMLSSTQCAGVMFARGAMGNPFIFRQTRELLQIGAYSEITPADKIGTAKKELMLLCEEAGEQVACREMRKRFAAYTKGIAGGAKLREQLVQASSIQDYERILENFSLQAV
ncbi:tRNA dihydrouridine synthase DusB [Treponema medium]|uniref:tRNA dihydrouridine synthase DusB n=1 Tax=Treponema medium TaxID=58231 RepID=UPI0019821D65|nr:tRNA dihydrouridine synthase DusB [Treponema medium]QSH93435.1 tRNA dihydrouridine synthase DusB [Treponema medium]